MSSVAKWILTTITAAVLMSGAFASRTAACGGFFCQLVPIDQAGEQIIFRQDGNMVTAVVLIQYAGEASDFSWVVPVPGIPELSTGSDLVFAPLELATRPRFTLETTGDSCPVFPTFFGAPSLSPLDGVANEDDGVDILETLVVGPFDVQIVASDDPDALATWLEDNDYDLSDRGRELIAPYVEQGMNFVALRLQQDQGVGDLQPLMMRYVSDCPMIPIRLTAVAAQENMGVIVWLLGESRAVPLNYLHVKPNYTRLNWYAGTRNAYASYQGLITAAMNEAGGQGFATDYAGRDLNYLSQIPVAEILTDELTRLSAIENDADLIASALSTFVFPQAKVLAILGRELPLPEGEGDFVYQIPELMAQIFTVDQLSAGRAGLLVELKASVVDSLTETLAVFDGDPYMTRLYTTLSPSDMTLDPIFSFNPELTDQSVERRATLAQSCGLLGERWSLTLGPGTGRDGELVIEGTGRSPFSAPTINQDAVFRTETVGASGPPTVVTQKQFDVAQVIGDGPSGGLRLCGLGTVQFGATTFGVLFMTLGFRTVSTSRRRSRRQ